MNLKEFTLITALVLHPGAINAIKTVTKGELIEAAKTKEVLDYHEIEISKTKLDSIQNIDIPDSLHTVVSRSTKDLKDTPLFMSGISKNIGEFLGYSQYKKILENYNTDGEDKTKIEEIDKVKFPLIYDDFRDNVKRDLSERVQEEKLIKYQEQLKDKTELLIIDTDKNQKSFLSYYVDNKLILCTYISSGVYSKENKSIETPKGVFAIGNKISHRRSQAHNNAPMAYALHIIRGVYQHQGYSDGKKRSHGCIRVPGLYQEFLFYHVKTGTSIVIL